MKLSEEQPAREVIAKLQGILNGHPPPWLAKIMGVQARERVRFDSDEPLDEE